MEDSDDRQGGPRGGCAGCGKRPASRDERRLLSAKDSDPVDVLEPSAVSSTPQESQNPAQLHAVINEIVEARFYSTYSGPLPDPRTLQRYEEILPGAAERIFGAWESETVHRQTLEGRVHSSDERIETRGQRYGFALSLVSLGVAVYLVESGHNTAGIALILGQVGVLAGAFLIGRFKQLRGPGQQSEMEHPTEKESNSPADLS